MGGVVDPNYKGPKEPVQHKSMEVRPRRLFTPEYAKEMKILINEVLDEREHKKRLAGAYDDVKPLPPSYLTLINLSIVLGKKHHPMRIGVSHENRSYVFG